MKTKIRVSILLLIMLAMCLLSGGGNEHKAYANGVTDIYVKSTWTSENLSSDPLCSTLNLVWEENAFSSVQGAIAKAASGS